jgi:hypothetical protein
VTVRRSVALALALSIPPIFGVASAQSTVRCTPSPRVDLRSATIGGLRLDTTIAVIRRAIGSASVRRHMVDSEEGRVPFYTIRICGHAVDRSQEGVSWSDSTYRSGENLGVGSTLSAFDSVFGVGQVSGDNGLQVRYEVAPYPISVEVASECYQIGPHSTVDRSCRVSLVGLDLRSRP